MIKRSALLAMVVLLPCLAQAQWVPGIGEDASIPRAGTIRLGVSARLEDYDRRYRRAGDDSLEPLGADFSDLDVERVPGGSLALQRIQTLAGIPNLTLSLGDLDVRLRGRAERVPISLELGVIPRFALTFTVPIVRTRSTVVIGPGIGANATAGINPALVSGDALSQNTSLSNALSAASQELRSRLDACAGSSDPSCNAINADRASAEAFAQSSALFQQRFASVYLESTVVPVGMSAADQAIASQLAALRSQFESYGIGTLSGAPVGPVPAAPIAAEELNALVTADAFGVFGDPLVTAERTAVGDIEAGAKLLLINRINPTARRAIGMRLLAGGVVRMGTGSQDLLRNLVDIGTGDGQTDFEGHAALDLVFGRRVALTAIARHTRQLEDELVLRVPSVVGQVFIPASDTALVARDLGDITTFEAVPRLAINEFLSIAGYFSAIRKTADRHEQLGGAPRPDGEIIAPRAELLDVGTSYNAQRVGFGIAFANLSAYQRGRARFPYEISYLHMRTTRGEDGLVPRATEDRVQVKLYVPLWR